MLGKLEVTHAESHLLLSSLALSLAVAAGRLPDALESAKEAGACLSAVDLVKFSEKLAKVHGEIVKVVGEDFETMIDPGSLIDKTREQGE